MGKTKTPPRKKNKTAGAIFGMVGLVFALLVLPTTALLSVGMLPTVIAAYTGDKYFRKDKALIVGAFNLMGCTPYLLDLWTDQHTIKTALEILAVPNNIIIMYAAAAIGYAFDMMISNFIASFLRSKKQRRLKTIEKLQIELTDRWGSAVKGEK